MLNRRQAMQLGAGALLLPQTGFPAGKRNDPLSTLSLIQRAIPSSQELLPVIGMGTSRTFDVSDDDESVAQLRQVMDAFIAGGGKVIDSSPMYGQSEARVGDIFRAMPKQPDVFAATKVWTRGEKKGVAQMQESARRMATEQFDLIAVHNLKDLKTQLKTLKAFKSEGLVRYIGITTSHGRHHDDFVRLMNSEPLDFVQFSYNIEDREAEKTLLPLAQDRGIATMINRPFQRGSLFDKARRNLLPDIAAELDCNSWGQFFLKFILAHPATTCIIPATAKVKHMKDNMQANFGAVPDAAQRKEMLRVFEAL